MTRRHFTWMLPATCCLAGDDARGLLEDVTQHYKALRSYWFEGKVISATTFKGSTSRSETGFVVAYEPPAKFRIEYRYPAAGNWLRVSDGEYVLESRSLAKESNRTRVTGAEIHALNGSAIHDFERLSETALHPVVMSTAILTVDGHPVECDVVQFEAGRREMREGQVPGPSMVWIAKNEGLVMREEIHTTSKNGNDVSESHRTTTIERFKVNQVLPVSLFDTH